MRNHAGITAVFVAILVGVMLPDAHAIEPQSENFRIVRYVFSGGGAEREAGSLHLLDAVLQTCPVGESTADSFLGYIGYLSPEFETGPPATATPTATPDTAVTATPTWSQTLTPSPTPAATHELGVELDMPKALYHPGDTFFLDAYVHNPDSPILGIPLFILLDVFSEYWFWPSWIHSGIDYKVIDVITGRQYFMVIEPFTWPDPGGQLEGVRFWGALTNRDITELMGLYDVITWGYGYPGRQAEAGEILRTARTADIEQQ